MEPAPRNNQRILIFALVAVIAGLVIGIVITSGGDDSRDSATVENSSVSVPERTTSTPSTTQPTTSQDSNDGGVSPPSTQPSGGTPAPGLGSGSGLNP